MSIKNWKKLRKITRPGPPSKGLQLRQAVHPDAAPDAQHVVFGQKVHIDAGELLQGTGVPSALQAYTATRPPVSHR